MSGFLQRWREILSEELHPAVRKVLLVSVVLAGVGVAVTWPRDRVFHVAASTDYLTLEFDRSAQNVWPLAGFAICGEFSLAQGGFGRAVEDACRELGLTPVVQQGPEDMLTLAPGTIAALFRSSAGRLFIEFYPPAGEDEVGSIATPADDRRVPVTGEVLLVGIGRPAALFTFTANATLGTSARPGVESILRAGSASVYETGLFNARRLKVDETELAAGDVVTLENHDGDPVPLSGFLVLPHAARGESPDAGIEVVAYAGTSQADGARSPERARITRFGTGGYELRPTVLMRVINEPWILAFGILMGAVGTLFENLVKVGGLFRRDPPPRREG